MPIGKALIGKIRATFNKFLQLIRYKYDQNSLLTSAVMEPTHRSPFAVAVAIAGVVAFLAFGLTVFLEVIGWLKHGYWEPIDVTDAFRSIGLAEPYFEEWVGAQKVWNILRQAPLSLVCLGIGLGLLTIARYLYWPTDRGGRMQR